MMYVDGELSWAELRGATWLESVGAQQSLA